MHRQNIVQPSKKKEVKDNNSLQHWAGCMMVDVCLVSLANRPGCSQNGAKCKLNDRWQWAGCIMVDMCMKFHLPIGLGIQGS